ncbi:unnamed protein product [Cochlearia groenlandica]
MSSITDNQTIIDHIVLFKVKDETTPTKVKSMVNDLNSLATINQVLHLTAAPIHRFTTSSSSSALTFTHVLHSRYRSKQDLISYATHPNHLRVVGETMPIWEDIMAVDWIGNSTQPLIGSVGRITLFKVKENVDDVAKTEITKVIKEGSCFGSVIISVGENFSTSRSKGFSIGSVSYFKDLDEIEELVKVEEEEKVFGDCVDETIVVEFLVPSSL